MKNIAVIILAAGRGTRMKSDMPKVLHEVHGRPMLYFVLEAVKKALPSSKKIIVIGHKARDVKNASPSFKTITQGRLLGSGDAVKKTEKYLSKFKGDIVVIYGDMPLTDSRTIKKLFEIHKKDRASLTILTAELNDPSGYGRVLRNDAGDIIKITEETDLEALDKEIKEINVGLYCFDKKDLFGALRKLKKNSKKKEYYLTDAIEVLSEGNKKISYLSTEGTKEVLGINSKSDLARANKMMKEKVLKRFMREGITIIDTDSVFIDKDAKIGRDTIIYPNTIIEKNVKIGKNCRIGPFARIRENTAIADNAEIGNFVELVRTRVSSGAKIKHMTYLGDAVVGKNVNIGAGTITANFDGKNKNKTVIGDGAFIGVGAIFIAPVKIGRGALVGAGSVVTRGKNVPPRKTVVGVPARILKKRRMK